MYSFILPTKPTHIDFMLSVKVRFGKLPYWDWTLLTSKEIEWKIFTWRGKENFFSHYFSLFMRKCCLQLSYCLREILLGGHRLLKSVKRENWRKFEYLQGKVENYVEKSMQSRGDFVWKFSWIYCSNVKLKNSWS